MPKRGLTGVACLVAVLLCAGLARADEKNVAAVVNGQTITLADVDDALMASNQKFFQQLFDERSKALDELIVDIVLKSEAEQKGITPKQLLDQRIAARGATVSDADVETFYNKNKNRMGGKTLEQMSARIRSYLAKQKKTTVRDAVMQEIKASADIHIKLDPPRAKLTITADDPMKGPADAPVTIVEYSEFQCPFCSRVTPTMKQIEETYGDKVRVIFRHFPLPMHKNAKPASEAAMCAQEQGKFWEFHDMAFANQRQLSTDNLKKWGADLGLNTEQFNACIDSNKYSKKVDEIEAGGRAVGVTGTPAFFVNGRFMSGAKPFTEFKAVIDDELSRNGVSMNSADDAEKADAKAEEKSS